MSNYSPLGPEQRYQIDSLIKAGLYQTQMDRIVGVHQSTTSRETRPNGGLRGYGPKPAPHLAQRRRLKVLGAEFLRPYGVWLPVC